ncbi:zinc-ribbon domain-containing protein [Bacillus benzoevorans]|uniref:Putative membrane protein n=1 Tax=Bacillus benzoevorans TaxID=1456 RepID=A0A7X0LW07_9BACI|nr:zinc-ribbon domain-containing protein [Bacillus benzoevorans]MBB6446080.1 putative membrane protein [Bacillus benzoevorans]
MICTKCGKSLADEAKFCDNCGTPTGTSWNDHDTYKQSDDEENKIVCILAYLGILFFIPLVASPESQAGRFHANQGLVLLIFSVAGQLILSILSAVLWFIAWLFGIIAALWGIAMFVLMILGMLNAAQGERKPLQFIGDIKIIK